MGSLNPYNSLPPSVRPWYGCLTRHDVATIQLCSRASAVHKKSTSHHRKPSVLGQSIRPPLCLKRYIYAYAIKDDAQQDALKCFMWRYAACLYDEPFGQAVSPLQARSIDKHIKRRNLLFRALRVINWKHRETHLHALNRGYIYIRSPLPLKIAPKASQSVCVCLVEWSKCIRNNLAEIEYINRRQKSVRALCWQNTKKEKRRKSKVSACAISFFLLEEDATCGALCARVHGLIRSLWNVISGSHYLGLRIAIGVYYIPSNYCAAIAIRQEFLVLDNCLLSMKT